MTAHFVLAPCGDAGSVQVNSNTEVVTISDDEDEMKMSQTPAVSPPASSAQLSLATPIGLGRAYTKLALEAHIIVGLTILLLRLQDQLMSAEATRLAVSQFLLDQVFTVDSLVTDMGAVFPYFESDEGKDHANQMIGRHQQGPVWL